MKTPNTIITIKFEITQQQVELLPDNLHTLLKDVGIRKIGELLANKKE